MNNTAYTDKELDSVRFITQAHWFECSIHESDLTEKRYTIIERHCKDANGFGSVSTDDKDEATKLYVEAKRRVIANIADALKAI